MSDATAPDTQQPNTLWAGTGRGAWIGLGLGSAIMALSMWWGLHVDAAERARIATEGAATMQGPLLMALLTVLVPIVLALIVGAGTGGSFAVRSAIAQPTAGFGRRYTAAVLPALVFAIGPVAAAVAAAALALLLTDTATGLEPTWGALFVSGGLSAAVAAVSTLACLAISSLVSGVMLRPPRR